MSNRNLSDIILVLINFCFSRINFYVLVNTVVLCDFFEALVGVQKYQQNQNEYTKKTDTQFPLRLSWVQCDITD